MNLSFLEGVLRIFLRQFPLVVVGITLNWLNIDVHVVHLVQILIVDYQIITIFFILTVLQVTSETTPGVAIFRNYTYCSMQIFLMN